MEALNGMQVIMRRGDCIFVRLPRELWRSCGRCDCSHCKGSEGFWDTLGVTTKPVARRNDTTWVVHMPESASRA